MIEQSGPSLDWLLERAEQHGDELGAGAREGHGRRRMLGRPVQLTE